MVLTIINLIQTPSPDDVSNKKKLLKQVLVELVATTVFVYFGTMSAVSTGKESSENILFIMHVLHYSYNTIKQELSLVGGADLERMLHVSSQWHLLSA